MSAIRFEEVALLDPEATDQLGARLAECLSAGDLVLLSGDLGAGKSALARAMIRTLLTDPGLEVPSPSFSLVQPYEGHGRSIVHADLYRLSRPEEAEELGLSEDPDAIVIVEWPERAPAMLRNPRLAVRLDIAPGGQGRIARLRWHPEAGQDGDAAVKSAP